MPDRTCDFTQSRRQSISKAKHACLTACDLTDMHSAVACLQTLFARPKGPDEDDEDMYLGVGSIIRLITESIVRREQAATDALHEVFEMFEREEAQ